MMFYDLTFKILNYFLTKSGVVMKHLFLFLFIFIVTENINSQTKQTDIPWATLADSPWPMVKHDPQFTGRSKYKGPQNGTVIWKKDLNNGIFSGPVIGEEGNLYFGSYFLDPNKNGTSDYFYSYTKDGYQIWSYKLGKRRPPQTGILIDSSNTIYFGSLDSNFYAINPDGSLKWKVNTGSPIVELAMPNIDLNGNLYIINSSGELCSISPVGNLNWKVKYENGFYQKSPVFSPDGNTIYIAGKDSNLVALNLEANLKWKFSCTKIEKSPIVDNDGNIYFSTNSGQSYNFYSIFPNGQIRWINDELFFATYSMPTIDNEGNIYSIAINKDCCPYYKVLVSLNNNSGDIRWKYVFFNGESDDFWQPLICDSEGTVYVGSTFGLLYYAISKEGELKWTIRLNDYQVDNTGAIAEDGTLYIGVHKTSLSNTNEQNLIAIKDTASVDVTEDITPVKEYSLSQNYPNPFNPSTTIQYSIPSVGTGLALSETLVTLKVYDILCREVATLVNENKPVGNYEVKFDGSNLSSGIYFYTLKAGSFTETKKMLLLK